MMRRVGTSVLLALLLSGCGSLPTATPVQINQGRMDCESAFDTPTDCNDVDYLRFYVNCIFL